MNHADRGREAPEGGTRRAGGATGAARPLELDTYKHLTQAFIHRGFRAISPPEKGQKTKC